MKILTKALAMALLLALIVAVQPLKTRADGPITVTVDGEPVAFPSQGPVIIGGVVWVPVYGIYSHIGFNALWDAAYRTAVISCGTGENLIFIEVGASEIHVFYNAGAPGALPNISGRDVAAEMPAQLINNRLMLPLETIAQAVGGTSVWDSEARTAAITTGFVPSVYWMLAGEFVMEEFPYVPIVLEFFRDRTFELRMTYSDMFGWDLDFLGYLVYGGTLRARHDRPAVGLYLDWAAIHVEVENLIEKLREYQMNEDHDAWLVEELLWWAEDVLGITDDGVTSATLAFDDSFNWLVDVDYGDVFVRKSTLANVTPPAVAAELGPLAGTFVLEWDEHVSITFDDGEFAFVVLYEELLWPLEIPGYFAFRGDFTVDYTARIISFYPDEEDAISAFIYAQNALAAYLYENDLDVPSHLSAFLNASPEEAALEFVLLFSDIQLTFGNNFDRLYDVFYGDVFVRR